MCHRFPPHYLCDVELGTSNISRYYSIVLFSSRKPYFSELFSEFSQVGQPYPSFGHAHEISESCHHVFICSKWSRNTGNWGLIAYCQVSWPLRFCMYFVAPLIRTCG